MAKSKKKKHQFKDFQKVKLKVGKKLAKADNVTDTFFKTRSIQIREQVSGTTNLQPTTRHKLNISDLFSRSSHYNASMRQDALTGLHELLSSHPALVHSHLSPLLSCLSHMFIDKEASVRTGVHRLLRLVFPLLSPTQIRPFFPLVTAHLCCAMTHICDDIQVDSLAVLDLCLQFYPALVTHATDQLLLNFIEQISRQGQAGQTRSLLVNPNSRLSSQKWRSKVLDRLHRFLRAMVHNQTVETAGRTRQCVIDCSNKTCHFQPLGSFAVSANIGAAFKLSSKSSVRETDVLSSRDRLRSFFDTLVPLLLQCWVEVAPDLHDMSLSDSTLSVDAVSTLGSVLGVLQLLLQCVLQADTSSSATDSTVDWVRDKYLKDFVHYFMLHFPYSVHETMKRQDRKRNAKQPKVCVVSLNLALCEVMGHFLVDPRGRLTKAGWTEVILDYVVLQLTTGRQSHDNVQSLLTTAGKMLKLSLSEDWQEQLLVAVLRQYEATTAGHTRPHLRLLADLLTSQPHLTSGAAMTQWLELLPRSLLQVGAQNEALMSVLMTLMKKVGSQGHKPFLAALQQHTTSLLETHFVTALKPDVQNQLVELVFYSPTLERQHFKQLTQLCRCHILVDTAVKYLLEVLHYRFVRNKEDPQNETFKLADYVAFLLSTLFGPTPQLDEDHQPMDTDVTDSRIRLSETSESDWIRDRTLAQITRHFVLQLPSVRQLWTVIQGNIEDVLTCPVVTVHSAVSVLELVAELHRVISGHSTHLVDCHLSETTQKHLATLVRHLLVSVTNMSPTDSCRCVNSGQAAEVVKSTGQTESSGAEGMSRTASSGEGVDGTGVSTGLVENVCACAYEACTELLYTCTDVYSTFLLQMSHLLEDCRSMPELKTYVGVLTRLLFVEKLRPQTKQHYLALQALVCTVERATVAVEQEQWWATFKYELSLLR